MLSAPSTGHADTAARIDLRSLIACSVAALFAGLAYLNALHNPFVYDDYHTVVDNGSILRVTDLRAIVLHDITRPIVNFSYAIDRTLWGASPLGFHVTNVLLHMLAVVLLFQLARHLSEDRLVSFAAASLFAVHPMMTEAVGYISGRSEVLCSTFFLSAMLCGRRWLRGDGARWGLCTVALWMAALATKETAAMFPFVLLAYDRLASRDSLLAKRRRLLTVHLPLIGAAVLAGMVRLAVLARIEYPGQVSVHWRYLLLDLGVIRRYIGLMVNPRGQALFHEVANVSGLLDPRSLVAVAVVGLMAVLAWSLRRVAWLASFGVVWFLLLLVPSSVLILFDQGELMTEHRVYLASCGLFLAVGAGLGWLGRCASQRSVWIERLAAAAFALVLLSFGVETLVRNRVWADPVRLWRESVDLAPTHYRPRLLLGEALQDAGLRHEALEEFQTAIRLRPTEPTGYVKAGRCLAETGHLQEARPYFLKAIEIDPQNLSARQSLAILETVESRLGTDAGRR